MAEIFNFLTFGKEERKKKKFQNLQNLRFGNLKLNILVIEKGKSEAKNNYRFLAWGEGGGGGAGG